MQQWEYFTELVSANIKNKGWEEYRRDNVPDFKPGKCSPRTMIPHLNNVGEEGWELVHMQPIAGVGANDDVWFTGGSGSWSNAYFCAWKRPKQEADAE